MLRNILFLLATTAALQVSAQQKKPPHQLKIYDTSDAGNHHFLSGDIIYYKLDTAEKRPIKMQCQAEGHPTPTYQWKKDGVVLQSSSNIVVDSTTGSLDIPDPNPTVDGYYQCFAKNDYGTGLSKIVQIVRRRLVGFGDEGKTQTVSTTVGSTFKIECSDPPVSIPAADFDWKIGEDKEEIPTRRSSIDAFGTLYFVYVTKADGGQPYYCSLTNGQSTEAGRRTILTVNDGVVTEFSPRVLHVSPETTGYRLGEATLECIFGGCPIPTVTWKNKDGEEIQTQVGKYEILDHTRKLKIKDLKDEHEGMYSCKGSNNLGNLEKQIFLNVTSKPIWTQAPDDQTAPVGGLAKFHCQARPAHGETSLSPPVWFKNGAELRLSDFGEDKKFLLSDEGTVLNVQNLQLEKDLMCIQCNITNDIGYKFKDASLTVIVAITIGSRPPDEITLGFGNSTELGVEATGGPYHDITYEWQHNGKPVKNNPPHVIVNENKLKIDTAGMNDTEFVNVGGVYTCVIKNGVQETRIDVLVTPDVEETTQEPVVSAAQLDLWWIALLIALIILIIIIILICCMCRQYPKGDYYVDEKERKAGHNPEKELQDSGFHDLSRADDDYPDKPRMDNVSLTGSEKPIESDEDSLTDYGDLDPGKFTEDGSFIGIYADKRKGTNQTDNDHPDMARTDNRRTVFLPAWDL